MGRTRTATFTLVSDMLAAPARPEAAPHARRRRRHRRAPPERGHRRSAVSSVRQRRGARAIPGERDAGLGRGPGRGGRAGGRGAGRGARAGRRPRRPRRLSSRAGPAERAAPRPLAAVGGPAAPPSSPPRPPALPVPGSGEPDSAARGVLRSRRARGPRGWGRGSSGRDACCPGRGCRTKTAPAPHGDRRGPGSPSGAAVTADPEPGCARWAGLPGS